MRSSFHSDGGHEVLETLRMVEAEHLDIRTTTLGLSLLDLAGSDNQLPNRVYDRITTLGQNLVKIATEVEDDLGVPIINKRVSVTPISMIVGGNPDLAVEVAIALDRAAADIGIDYIAGYSALVHKGFTTGDTALIDAIPEALAQTERERPPTSAKAD